MCLGAGTVALAQDAPLAPPEFRGVWADAFHDGFRSESQVTEMIHTLSEANYNALVVEVRKCGDAYYNSAFEPRASNILDPEPFDPLADIVAKAHAAGLEVHAWIVTYRIWSDVYGPAPPGHIWNLHPEWAMADKNGNTLDGSYYNLDPGIPEVQDYICRVAADIVEKYDIDGFNFDYIRYPSGYYWGYNEITRQRFHDEFGFWPPLLTTNPNWDIWAAFRRRQVTDLVRKCALEIWARKPGIKISADTIGWTGADPNTDYTETRQYKEVFQDSRKWAQQHLIDINMLMNYKREYEPAQSGDFRVWTDFISSLAEDSGRHAVDGQAAYLNGILDSLTQMSYARTAGCQGSATYSFASTNKDGQPAAEFFNAVQTNLYTTKVPLPDMPWKTSPTTGFIFGQVFSNAAAPDPVYRNWIYRASVTVEGPVTRTVLSDATGTYGFLDLPPGEYRITATRNGLPTETREGILLHAGQVLRMNFDLSDRDGDGRVPSKDCDDTNGSVWGIPGEVTGLIFGRDRQTLSWLPPDDPGGLTGALVFDVLRSLLANSFETANCSASEILETSTVDEALPEAGNTLFYLVRAGNPCPAKGTLGKGSDGSTRQGRSCP